MTRLVLTLSQARDLQRSTDPWPAHWAFAVQPEREKPDTLADPERMTIALEMKGQDCTDEQIAMQLGWKPDSSPLRQMNRLHKRGIK